MTQYTSFASAVIWTGTEAGEAEEKAADVLAEEIYKRTGISLAVQKGRPSKGAAIGIGTWPELTEESCRVEISSLQAEITGGSPRGCFYGVGRLLRLMKWENGIFELPSELRKEYTPKFQIRGHQLGYRPKTNAYDAWTIPIFEQYIRDLVFFGANAIELLPPCTDDDSSTELIQCDPMEMMAALSEIIHSYGIETWVWYPNLAKDYSEGGAIAEEISQRREVFAKTPYIDHVFIPGGDPGELRPKELFRWSEKVADLLREYHPKAKMWISPQTGEPSVAWCEEFYGEVEKHPPWLNGIVFAPWERDSAEVLRKRVPPEYPIRNYPDITHSLRCQYPVPHWDMAMALTLGRECTNPRPLGEKKIHNLYQDYFIGSVSYSEGINDDVNKFIWLDQEWDSSIQAVDTLRDYAGLFIDWQLRGELAQGFLGEEENLSGPLAMNQAVDKTFFQWCALEKTVGRYAVNNYRFEMGLIRAYFDKYQKERYLYEAWLEREAVYALENCCGPEVEAAIEEAERILLLARKQPIRREWSQKINQLADLLFEHIGAQLTVTRHHAAAWDRGAYVDSLDAPLNDSRYLLTCLKKAKYLSTDRERMEAVYQLVHRCDPGPGGFYDNFESFGGCGARLEAFMPDKNDPAYLERPLPSFLLQSPFEETDVPLAWRSNVYTLYQKPLMITYDTLEDSSDYWIRVTYGRYHSIDVSLYGGPEGDVKIHDAIRVDASFCTVETRIPREAYREGKLILRFTVRDGQRGPNVSEIMITKRPLTQDAEVLVKSFA